MAKVFQAFVFLNQISHQQILQKCSMNYTDTFILSAKGKYDGEQFGCVVYIHYKREQTRKAYFSSAKIINICFTDTFICTLKLCISVWGSESLFWEVSNWPRVQCAAQMENRGQFCSSSQWRGYSNAEPSATMYCISFPTFAAVWDSGCAHKERFTNPWRQWNGTRTLVCRARLW